MTSNKIAVGIVLYNPDDIKRFYECLSNVSKQSENIYIFDNSTNRCNIELPSNVTYMTNGRNVGVAYALNRIFERAEEDGFEWVITMDQDSILPDGVINAYRREIENDPQIAIVCPQIIDERRNYMSVKREPEKEYVHKCITSGSCTSIEAWHKVGEFDEWLFIDLVDNEFCKRIIATGYLIKRLNKYILNQEFGQIIPKSQKKQQFWLKVSKILHNVNFAKFSYKKKVSPLRVYYTNRNIIYVNRKMRLYGKVGYDSYNCKNYVGFIISFVLPSIIRAEKKSAVLKATVRGISDGRKKNVGVWKV